MVIWSLLNSCSSWSVGHWFSPKTSITSTKQWCWTPSSFGFCFSHKFYETPIASHRLTLTPPPTKKVQKTTDQKVSSNKSNTNPHKIIKVMSKKPDTSALLWQSCLQLDLHQGSRHQPHNSISWRDSGEGDCFQREWENIGGYKSLFSFKKSIEEGLGKNEKVIVNSFLSCLLPDPSWFLILSRVFKPCIFKDLCLAIRNRNPDIFSVCELRT